MNEFEPKINQGDLELLDISEVIEQAVSLVWRGQKIDHEPGGHDDLINAVALAVDVLHDRSELADTSFDFAGVCGMGARSDPYGGLYGMDAAGTEFANWQAIHGTRTLR